MHSKRAWLFPFLATLAANAFAQAAEGLSFDCWVGNAGGTYTTQFIRCIADRPLAQKTLAELDERFDSLLDILHSQIHAGAIADAERTLRANAGNLRQGEVWHIRLYSYPFDSSWAEGRPQMIVRSALCRNDPGCQVNFHRP